MIRKRVLCIAQYETRSVSTNTIITKLSESEILCDGFATSKALDNPYFKPSLELFFEQQTKCDAILFNNGLHGWHLSDAEYENYYDEMLAFLLKTEKPLSVLLTTDVTTDQKRDEIVITRNEIAKKLAKKYDLPVIDLHSVAKSNPKSHVSDGVHFAPEGYELLAKCILESLQK